MNTLEDLINYLPDNDCMKCMIWDRLAKQSGYQGGMCQYCYNQHYVNYLPVDMKFDNALKDGV